tara:strand:+ start:63 stop:791 length:729 start_codon:yes stop_codon:yes gene_type:complete
MAYVRKPVYTKDNYGKTVSSTIPHPDAMDGKAFENFMNQVAVYGAAQGPRLQNAMAGARQYYNIPVQNLGTGAAKTKAYGLGMKAAKFSPYLPAASNLLEGDLVGAGLSVAGAGIGKALTGRLAGAAMGAKLGPWGALAGGILGEPVIRGVVGGAGRLAGGILGGVTDYSDPLSGRDISILGFPLTPYAKTKKRQKKELQLAEMRLPLYDKIADAQTQRAMALSTGNNIANLVGKVYAANPY